MSNMSKNACFWRRQHRTRDTLIPGIGAHHESAFEYDEKLGCDAGQLARLRECLEQRNEQ